MKHNCALLKSSIPLKESVYGLCRLKDSFSGEEMILFVHNTREERSAADGGGFKPAGYGLPGGKLKPRETVEAGVVREFQQETGLVIVSLRELCVEHHLMLRNSADEVQYIPCEDAVFLSGEPDPESASQTLIHVFEVTTNWLDSSLRPVFFLLSQFSDWKGGSALVFGVSPEAAMRLDIVEAEAKPGRTQEIDAIALLGVSSLPRAGETLDNPYKTHLRRIKKCLGKMQK